MNARTHIHTFMLASVDAHYVEQTVLLAFASPSDEKDRFHIVGAEFFAT
jgi:hypothetical protein